MKLQYFHCTEERFTVALEPPTKEVLRYILEESHGNLFVNIGFAKVHPKDQFVKAIGRAVAGARVKPVKLTFHHAYVHKNKTYYRFSCPVEGTNEFLHFIGFSAVPTSNSVHLEQVEIR